MSSATKSSRNGASKRSARPPARGGIDPDFAGRIVRVLERIRNVGTSSHSWEGIDLSDVGIFIQQEGSVSERGEALLLLFPLLERMLDGESESDGAAEDSESEVVVGAPVEMVSTAQEVSRCVVSLEAVGDAMKFCDDLAMGREAERGTPGDVGDYIANHGNATDWAEATLALVPIARRIEARKDSDADGGESSGTKHVACKDDNDE